MKCRTDTLAIPSPSPAIQSKGLASLSISANEGQFVIFSGLLFACRMEERHMAVLTSTIFLTPSRGMSCTALMGFWRETEERKSRAADVALLRHSAAYQSASIGLRSTR